MKDYPEAQEILQALGRKRLMEVNRSNALSAKKSAARQANNQPSSKWHHIKGSIAGVGTGVVDPQTLSTYENGASTDSDATTPRKIIDKFKCEARVSKF